MEKIYIPKSWVQKAAVCIVVAAAGILYWIRAQDSWQTVGEAESRIVAAEEMLDESESQKESENGDGKKEQEESGKSRIGVHVTGAVNAPDQVYYLEEGARVSDAITAAGGAREDADLSQLNLAGYIQDGQRIYVPEEGEIVEIVENSIQENHETLLTNINLATKIELLELPGIGEAYAQRIIDYREENGPFQSIEDIMKVKGIGESKFDDLKDRITVE